MKILLDTNVLIAANVKTHPHHAFAEKWLFDMEKELAISAHSILETYSGLTRIPFKPKIKPAEANYIIIDIILPKVEILTLEDSDYTKVVQLMSENNFVGGIIYDAAIIHCAVRNGVKKIVTANLNHFQRIVNTFNYDCEIIDLLNRE
ncbi:MAG: type II toxin-antitoxin system VapC family toxin [Saprospiraceae bacterium]